MVPLDDLDVQLSHLQDIISPTHYIVILLYSHIISYTKG